MGTGVVKYPGYSTGGSIPTKGVKNKRSAHARKQRDLALRRRREAEQRRADRADPFNDWENDY